MKKNKEKMTIDKFGEIMDNFLKNNHIGMTLDFPEGTMEPDIQDNVEAGPVVQFYLLMYAMTYTCRDMLKMMEIPEENTESLVDSMLELMKTEIMKAATGENDEGKDDI